MGKKKELVVSVIFNGHDGERYKIPTTYHGIEKIFLLDCGDIDCLGQMVRCENCIFYKGKTFRKNELHLIVEEKEEGEEEYNLEGLEEIRDLDKMEKYKDVKKFVIFKDKKDRTQLLPFIGNLIIIDEEIKIGCRNIDCYCHGDLHCFQCPFVGGEKLDRDEFKILKPKDDRSEEK